MTEPEESRPDAVAAAILTELRAAGAGASLSPDDIARAFAEGRRKKSDPPDLWRRYLNAGRQQALHLARRGQVVTLRPGAPQEPNAPVKGRPRPHSPVAQRYADEDRAGKDGLGSGGGARCGPEPRGGHS